MPSFSRKQKALLAVSIPLVIAGGGLVIANKDVAIQKAEWLKEQADAGMDLFDMVVDAKSKFIDPTLEALAPLRTGGI